MTVSDIESQLQQELSIVLNQTPGELDVHRPLHELGVDSLAFVELLVFIEKRFGLVLLDAGLTRADLESLHAIASCVHRLIGSR